MASLIGRATRLCSEALVSLGSVSFSLGALIFPIFPKPKWIKWRGRSSGGFHWERQWIGFQSLEPVGNWSLEPGRGRPPFLRFRVADISLAWPLGLLVFIVCSLKHGKRSFAQPNSSESASHVWPQRCHGHRWTQIASQITSRMPAKCQPNACHMQAKCKSIQAKLQGKLPSQLRLGWNESSVHFEWGRQCERSDSNHATEWPLN